MPTTRTQYEEDLDRLRDMILAMGAECDRAVAQAIKALQQRDRAIAERVIDGDEIIDQMDLQIEAESMRLLALQQPIARDLRLIGTALKIITDLERVGDHAVDVAKVARKLADIASERPLADLPQMAQLVRGMLKHVLDAFVRHDLSLVDQVVLADDQVDDLFHKIRTDLHAAMEEDPTVVVEGSYLLFVAHYLERMADHCVNIAERVHFVETGRLDQLDKEHKTAT